jgi:hypothetical protein
MTNLYFDSVVATGNWADEMEDIPIARKSETLAIPPDYNQLTFLFLSSSHLISSHLLAHSQRQRPQRPQARRPRLLRLYPRPILFSVPRSSWRWWRWIRR